MDEYIKREDLAKMIEDNVNLPLGEGYTKEDHELVDWCKAECIRQAHCLPFVCDVVPKSEVEAELPCVAYNKKHERYQVIHKGKQGRIFASKLYRNRREAEDALSELKKKYEVES